MNKKDMFKFLKLLKQNQVITYNALAKMFNSSPRGVAKILSLNKDKKVPCYRVIKSNGELGGYNNLLKKSKSELLGDNFVILS
jgi:alkylated DNA nucleotide flippase Atl1